MTEGSFLRKVVNSDSSRYVRSDDGLPESFWTTLSCGHKYNQKYSRKAASEHELFLSNEELFRHCPKCADGSPPDYRLITVGDLSVLDKDVCKKIMRRLRANQKKHKNTD